MLKFLERISGRFAGPRLTQVRVVTAITFAAVADFLQIVLIPGQWFFVQQVIDVIAMVLTMVTLGFHLLLLPTFVVELIPIADMLPTWTGCVIAVIALRKRAQRSADQLPPSTKKISDEPPPPPL